MYSSLLLYSIYKIHPTPVHLGKKTVTRKATKPYTGNNTSGVAAGGEKKKKYSSQQQHCFSFSVLTHSPPNTCIFLCPAVSTFILE